MKEQYFYFYPGGESEKAQQYAETIGSNVSLDSVDSFTDTLSFETGEPLSEEQVTKLKSYDPYSWGYE